MDIGGAIKALKAGKPVTRREWQRHATKGETRYLVIFKNLHRIYDSEDKKYTNHIIRPSIWLKNFDDTFIPATFSQLDIMAEDYVLFKS